MAALPADDRDLDDDALWAVIDSAAASSYSSPATTISRYRKPLTPTTNTSKFLSPTPKFLSPPPPPPPQYHHRNNHSTFPITDDFRRPAKILRSSSSCISELSNTSPHSAGAVCRWPINPVYQVKELSPYVQENVSPPTIVDRRVDDNKENFTHCLSGRYPTVSLFKDYQKAAMQVLEKSDYTMISGNPYIKKSGWRKIAFYFNVSFEIKDKTIEFDDNRNVQRAEFVIRAYMQSGRFSDGWGSCERREKKFMKPNNDVPSTAETRAKNRACQDLIGIGSSWCKP